MKSFAAVIRSLLVRVRALEVRRPGDPWSPSATADGGPRCAPATGGIYRVPPTAWGVSAACDPGPDRAPAAPRTGRRAAMSPSRHRRRLDLSVYGLPVPRGLL